MDAYGILSLIFGLLGILSSYWYVGIVLCVVGLVLGIVGMVDSYMDSKPSLIGALLSVLGAILSIFFVVSDMDSDKLVINSSKFGGEKIETVKNDDFMRFHREDGEAEKAEDIEIPMKEAEEQEGKKTTPSWIDDSNEVERSEGTVIQSEENAEVQLEEIAEEEREIEKSENENYSVQILAEYTLPDGINWYTRRFMIIKNDSNETVEVQTSSIAYGQDDSMVSASESTLYALGAGCTSIVYEPFETDKAINRYDTDIKTKKDEFFESVLQDLSYTQNNIEDGAIFQVTNNGSEPADFVEGYALFFRNGQLVEYESAFFIDSDGELKPGATVSKQLSAYEDYDRMEFYLTGRR